MSAQTTQDDPLHMGYVGYFSLVHLVGAIGIWYAIEHAALGVIVFSIAYFFAAHLSITCGAHRLYAHDSYVAFPRLQYLLVLLFSATAQGPITWWVGKHRLHHNQEDKPDDPHSPLHGFFHAHMGWLLYESGWKPSVAHTAFFYRNKEKYAAPIWQERNRWVLIPVMAIGIPTLVGFLFGDPLGGFLVGGFARLLVQYHCTWIVNSVGHTFGQHAGRSKTATNNWWLAIPTVGESFHANHHDEADNYRLGRQWYDIDLGYYAILLAIRLGYACEKVRA